MAKSNNHLVGHYFALLLGDQLGSPMPKKARNIIVRLDWLKKRIEIRDNFFNIDIDSLDVIRKEFDKASKLSGKRAEKKFDAAMDDLFSWCELNNIWVGTATYITTRMKADNGYKIGK